MILPQNNKLPISALAGIFNNTSATYKFYWFVTIMEIVVKEHKTKISLWEIIAGMIAESWYPIHYFKLSFGKSDSLYDAVVGFTTRTEYPYRCRQKESQAVVDRQH